MEEKERLKQIEITLKEIYEADQNVYKRTQEEEKKKEEMLDNFKIEKEIYESIENKKFIPPVIKEAEKIVKNKIKRLKEDEEILRDSEDFAFELWISERWRPCPRCEMCDQSDSLGKPIQKWCKQLREEKDKRDK